MLKPPLHNEIYENKEQMKETVWSTGGCSVPWAHQANKKSRVVPVDGLESDSADVFYCDVHLEIICFFIFFLSRHAQLEDKNGVSTWRDHHSTRVCCVTNLHSSLYVAYPSS